MSSSDERSICLFCKGGPTIKREETIAFHQGTDKGNVFCRISIPVVTCASCGARTWDDTAEAAIDEAVRKEYQKLA
jgi:hypothetical protein